VPRLSDGQPPRQSVLPQLRQRAGRPGGSLALRRAPGDPSSFETFQASVLFCARCRAPQPVRERLLLLLPDGELHEYLCTACGHGWEAEQSISAAALTTCPNCHAESEKRQVSGGAGFILLVESSPI